MRAARSKIGMILPRRPMTPRIQSASEATARGSVKRMISCTCADGERVLLRAEREDDELL